MPFFIMAMYEFVCLCDIFVIHSFINGHLSHSIPWLLWVKLHEHRSVDIWFFSHFLCIFIQKWNCWIINSFHFLFFWGNSYVPQWLHQFTFSPTVYEAALFSTSSPRTILSCIFDDSQPNSCELISHYGFYLYFPDD